MICKCIKSYRLSDVEIKLTEMDPTPCLIENDLYNCYIDKRGVMHFHTMDDVWSCSFDTEYLKLADLVDYIIPIEEWREDQIKKLEI